MTLRADNIHVQLADFELLRQINLSLRPGEITAIVGPNGAGKSSLLKVLTGDLTPTSGAVSLNGKALDDWPLKDRAQMMAVLPQYTPLNFPFNAREVVELGRIPHGTGKVRDKDIVDAALAAVDGSYLVKRLYTQMSGGEKQRVQLARVLTQVWEPSNLGDRYLILDEPTSAFDLSHQLITLDIVSRCASEGVGVLIVLHDLNLAARCADNLIVMTCGQIAAQGEPADILSEALMKDVFDVDAVIMKNPLNEKPLVIT